MTAFFNSSYLLKAGLILTELDTLFVKHIPQRKPDTLKLAFAPGVNRDLKNE